MSNRRLPGATKVLAWVGMALLYIPLFFVALESFNANKHGQTWGGFTLGWYGKLLHNVPIQSATLKSLILAVVSTLIATVLGTLLAVGKEDEGFLRYGDQYPGGHSGYPRFVFVCPSLILSDCTQPRSHCPVS